MDKVDYNKSYYRSDSDIEELDDSADGYLDNEIGSLSTQISVQDDGTIIRPDFASLGYLDNDIDILTDQFSDIAMSDTDSEKSVETSQKIDALVDGRGLKRSADDDTKDSPLAKRQRKA